MFSRKLIKFTVLFVFLTFAGAVLSESFVHCHHHSKTEEDDCSLCSFNKAVKAADLSLAPVEIIPVFALLLAPVVFQPAYSGFRLSSYSGRAPPILPQK